MADLILPRTGFGAAGIGNHLRAVTDQEARELLQAAWESGVRHFDTAPHYGLGLSERRLGEFLATKPRSEFIVSTKVGRLLAPNPAGAGQLDDEDFVVPAEWKRVWDFTSSGVRRSLAGSLERLGLDSVDVVYLHDPERWNLPAALDEGLPALSGLRSAGLVTAIGVASMSTDALLAAADSGSVDLLMAAGRFTLADQSAATEVLPACERHGVRVVSAAIFNGDLLATSPDESSTFDYATVPGEVLDRARKIEAVCASYGVPLRAAALQYPFRHGVVSAVMVGGQHPDQIRSNTEDVALPIPAELWAHLQTDGLVAL
jgi:D-threo-aldose 1-dehydrogenase